MHSPSCSVARSAAGGCALAPLYALCKRSASQTAIRWRARPCAWQHAAHVHEAVDGAFAALVLDRHTGSGQRRGIFGSLVAQGIVPGGDDQRRRQAGVILVERGDRARIGDRPGQPEIMAIEPLIMSLRDRKLVGKLLARRATGRAGRAQDKSALVHTRAHQLAFRLMQRDRR